MSDPPVSAFHTHDRPGSVRLVEIFLLLWRELDWHGLCVARQCRSASLPTSERSSSSKGLHRLQGLPASRENNMGRLRPVWDQDTFGTSCGPTPHSPINSLRLSSLVVPMIGAVTNSLAKLHARAIWAMDTPLFLASSATRSLTHWIDSSGLCRPRPLYPLREIFSMTPTVTARVRGQ